MSASLTPYRPEIEAAARRHEIDPDLLEAIVLTESSGRADAFRYEPAFYRRYLKDNPSYQGQIPRRISSSYGLCQIMLPVAREMGFRHEPEMLFLPQLNLDYGARHLKKLLVWAEGDVERAVRAYNGGKGGADKPLTDSYWRRVSGNLRLVKMHARLQSMDKQA